MKKWVIAQSSDNSPFLQKTRRFGAKDSIYLVDQYGGKLPTLINNGCSASLANKEVYPCALFDSNLMDVIEKRVNGVRHPGFDILLWFLTKNRWDFNPEFYLIEQYCKSPQLFQDIARRRIDYWLEIYSMNQSHFLREFEIQCDSEAEDFYCSRYGVKKMSDIADVKINKILKSGAFIAEMKKAVTVSEILIYKMILLHHFEAKGKPPLEKLQAYEAYQKELFGIGMAREYLLAMLYFNNQAGSLLGIQPNTSIMKAEKNISSTAWDLLLVRMPEFGMNNTSEPFTIPYVATKERALASYANMVTCFEIWIDGQKGIPAQEINLSSLPKRFQQELHEHFITLPSRPVSIFEEEELLRIREELAFALKKRLR